MLERLADTRGLPLSITVDHGPEFEGQVLDAWAYEAGVRLSFIRPGKPNENAYIESFNGKFRDECLNEHWFINMGQARRIIEDWRVEYNTERPHSSLGNLTPEEFARNKDRAFLTADSNASPDQNGCQVDWSTSSSALAVLQGAVRPATRLHQIDRDIVQQFHYRIGRP